MQTLKVTDHRASQETPNGGSIRAEVRASEARELRPAGIRIERMTVTPEQAKYWLDVTNVRNRPINKAFVRKLVSDRTHGLWKDTHQGIAFDLEGHLVDGQHRLLMIVQSGLDTELTVTYGLETDAMEGIDQTYRRVPAHILAAEGVQDSRPLSAIARTILVCTHDKNATHPEVVRFVQTHLEILKRYTNLVGKYSAGVAAAFAYADILGWEGTAGAAERLAALLWASDGDPMRALANALRSLTGKSGARSVQVRFFTSLNTLKAVRDKRDLAIAKKIDHDTSD